MDSASKVSKFYSISLRGWLLLDAVKARIHKARRQRLLIIVTHCRFFVMRRFLIDLDFRTDGSFETYNCLLSLVKMFCLLSHSLDNLFLFKFELNIQKT